jgi:ATP-dependent DNA ligase
VVARNLSLVFQVPRRLAAVPDYAPARLQAVKVLPAGSGWIYEPKWDGYRGLLVTSPTGKGSVWSRNGKDLGRYFPELIDLARRLPRDTVLDGEIVRPTETGVSFIELQQRLFAPAAARRESPAAFIGFDLLRQGEDLRRERLSMRRRRLEELATAQADQLLQVVTQTTDRDEAMAWLDESLTIAGIEGVVAKLDEPYPKPDAKRWRKVRRIATMEFTVRGFIPEGGAVRLVLASVGQEERLVGTSYPISGVDLKPLESLIPRSMLAEHRVWAPFEDGRHDWYELRDAEALLAEVVITTLDSGMLRQPARFVRWRAQGPTGR